MRQRAQAAAGSYRTWRQRILLVRRVGALSQPALAVLEQRRHPLLLRAAQRPGAAPGGQLAQALRQPLKVQDALQLLAALAGKLERQGEAAGG